MSGGRAGADGVPPRLALTRNEAVICLGVSVNFFERHVLHQLRTVRVGRRRLVPVAELERWLETHAVGTLEP